MDNKLKLRITVRLTIVVVVLSMASLSLWSTGPPANAKSKLITPHLTIHLGKKTLSYKGGAVAVTATAGGVTLCSWTSVPTIKGFDAATKCGASFKRSVKIPTNTTKKSRAYTFIVKGFVKKKSYIAAASLIEGKYTKPSKPTAVVTASAPTTTTTTSISAPSTTTIVTTTTTTTTTIPIATTDLAVHLDPTFVQNASNPLEVTYTASATASTGGVTVAQLPQGVLDFYSDGMLICSNNVGGSTTTSTCEVTYTAIGEHTVVTEYISGTNSATETDVEEIAAQSTITTVQLIGDPGATPTPSSSTLTATVASNVGAITTFAASAITFSVDSAILTTTQANQTSCTLNWTGPSFNQQTDSFTASVTSSNCIITGTPLQNISSMTYSASFAGTTGLSQSSSTTQTGNDWPQVPAPKYSTGSDYVVTWGSVTLVSLGDGDYDITAYASTSPVTNYSIRVSAGDSVLLMLGPDVGGSTQLLYDTNALPFDLTFTYVPTISPVNVITWQGDQETITQYGFTNTVMSGSINI